MKRSRAIKFIFYNYRNLLNDVGKGVKGVSFLKDINFETINKRSSVINN